MPSENAKPAINIDAAPKNPVLQGQTQGLNEQGYRNDTSADTDEAITLSIQADALYNQYQQSNQTEELNAAIEYYNQALSLAHDQHLNKSAWLYGLGNLYHRRYNRSEDVADLDMAIGCKYRAVSETRTDDPERVARLSSLADSHHSRFKHLGELPDMEMALDCIIQVVSLTPEDHADYVDSLNNLGTMYLHRCDQLGGLEDLNLGIDCLTRSVAYAQERGLTRPGFLSNLGLSYQVRFRRLGELSDLHTSIKYLTQVESLAPEGDPDKATWLNHLGSVYLILADHVGELPNFDVAVNYLSRAVSLVPDEDSYKPAVLNNLGHAYQRRFQRLEARADLDACIDCLSHSVSRTPQGHPSRPIRLSSLSAAYFTRSDYFGGISDLDFAISSMTEALSLTHEAHPIRPLRFHNLGISYKTRFKRFGVLEDLDKQFFYLEQAVSHAPDGHSELPLFLVHLGHGYLDRYEHLGELPNLDMAIRYCSRAAQLASDRNSSKPEILMCLSSALHYRFRHSGSTIYLVGAIRYVKEAALSNNGPPLTRFNAACNWAKLTCMYGLPSPLEAYRQAITIIPQVIWIGSTADRRYEVVAPINDEVITAASLAAYFEEFGLAMQWLEEGRSIVWNQLLQLRTPLDQLATVDAPLAEELEQATQALQQVSSMGVLSAESLSDQSALEEVAQRQRRLAETHERLVERARSLPGLGNFLRSSDPTSLLAASRTGAVVIINIHLGQCHALVMRPHATAVECVSLTNLSHDKAATARIRLTRSLRSQGRTGRGVRNKPKSEGTIEDILCMLWTDVAKPVLDFLGYTRNGSTNELPHITWCTTGPLTLLPLHAAGDYSKPGCSLFDFAISSFTPSLSALLVSPPKPNMSTSILAIGQALTPNFSPLPGTKAELDQISKRVDSRWLTRLEGEAATTSAVLSSLDNHSWAHFACHASQNLTKPTSSAFHLHDGSLSLAAIAQKKLEHADLAFLSACQTATGDEQLPEEAVHLAAGMLMAGYRRVVATMWSIDDGDAPLVADMFYGYMLDETMPSERKAAKALHHAVGCLKEAVMKHLKKLIPPAVYYFYL
ncbi:hypothetical protein FRC10_011528 [Ceratobasidium sp. 414]|nr:hypothetical protein FRC10_011528 [Ceratobasidium sp. 414]